MTDAWMQYAGYEPRITPRSAVPLSRLADHIDHICQMTGSVQHAAIGSDLVVHGNRLAFFSKYLP